MKNTIGLNKNAAEKLATELNNLLATYQVFYMNVRGYHWNIKGVNFLNYMRNLKKFMMILL